MKYIMKFTNKSGKEIVRKYNAINKTVMEVFFNTLKSLGYNPIIEEVKEEVIENAKDSN